MALLEDGILLAESYQNTGLTHSQTIMAMAENLLTTCGLRAQDVDAVAVAAGPGSFTGVRIGVAAAKGFAWGRELPLYGVSTLEAMARSLGLWEGVICCAMDARRNQVYNALFRAEKGELYRLTEDRAIALEDLKPELKALSREITILGDGASICCHAVMDEVPVILAPEHRRHQRAAGVVLAAMEAVKREKQGDAGALQPNYLRLSQAERERAERIKAPETERKD